MLISEDRLRLAKPIIQAPMAGGPSNANLCAAVSVQGGLGMLAGGYLSCADLEKSIRDVEAATKSPYGINLFWPDTEEGSTADGCANGSSKNAYEYAEYRQFLEGIERYVSELGPEDPRSSDDGFREKFSIALASGAKYITFTFGMPNAEAIHRCKRYGKQTMVTVTTRAGVIEADRRGVDVIVLQGLEAGGHRGLIESLENPDDQLPIRDLLEAAIEVTNKPLVAAGGVSRAYDVIDLLRRGANAVQVGTLFLTASEAGTKAAHKKALLLLKDRTTVLTRAFSGKDARAIRNTFTDKVGDRAPKQYPEVHFLTAGMRKAANENDDYEYVNLWAGTGFSGCREQSAQEVITTLLPYSVDELEPCPGAARADVAIIGGGPRGLAVVQQLAEEARKKSEHISVNWYDDNGFGSGRVWSPYQSTMFLMNTVASQLSAFPDRCWNSPNERRLTDSPLGLTMYEWLQSPHCVEFLQLDDELRSLAGKVGPNDYPPRALYGAYLQWALEQVISSSSDVLRLHRIASRVTGVSTNESGYLIVDNLGGEAQVKSVVLALGHTPQKLASTEEEIAAAISKATARYIPTGDCTIRKCASVPSGGKVIMRGLGLVFFDYMSAFTEGRGGSFVTSSDGLKYEPSGREPTMYLCSRRGVPHMARGINQKGADERWEPRFLGTGEDIVPEDCASRAFGKDVWPEIVKEVEFAYTIAESADQLKKGDLCRIREALTSSQAEYLQLRQELGLGQSFPWGRILRPEVSAGRQGDHATYVRAFLEYLDSDIKSALEGNVKGPFKAALDVFRDLRNEVRENVQYGRISGRSFRDEVRRLYTPLNAFVSIGPPVSRIEQLKALVEAGLAIPCGPAPHVSYDARRDSFVMVDRFYPENTVEASCLIEARLPTPDVTRTADPLLASMIDAGILKPHFYEGTRTPSGAVAVDTSTFLATNKCEFDGGVYAYGLPLEGMQWGTAATIRPFVNSVIMDDAKVIAQTILEGFSYDQ